MVFLSGRESVQVLYHLFIYALLLEIQLSRGEVWDPVIKRGGLEIQLSRGECLELNGLTPPHCVCLTVTRTWISNVKVRDDIVLLVLVELLTITV